MPTYHRFNWKDTNARICSTDVEVITREIVHQRTLLEAYISRDPAFAAAMVPVGLKENAPLIAQRMHHAARQTGVGPMAAVAGTIAQMAVEAACSHGAREAIVENGGDGYFVSDRDLHVGLHLAGAPFGDRLAFRLTADELPLAICSSSGTMGHSMSLGRCDLATVVAADASLADAAATLACNLVRDVDDLDATLERIAAIPGIRGVQLIKGDRLGRIGWLPELVENPDANASGKITRDARWQE